MDATELVTEVPDPLKKLLKYVMRAFYTTEEVLVMDLLLRNACMKEEDIVELLKLDKKQMGISIKRLKNDQFIKTRMKVESDSEGKTTKHNYYFIHYTGFVNVVKYKLDHVRRKLEMQERDSTSRASFECKNCCKTYTDLEADHLFDMNTGTFNCMMCGCEMEEQQSSAPVKDARALVAKYNEQIEKLFILMRDCDKFKLHHTILEPAPIDISQLGMDRKQGQAKHGEKSASSSGPRTWSGDATKNVEFGLRSHDIDVKLGESAASSAHTHVKKEQPAWMTQSTVDGVNTNFLPTSQTAEGASAEAVPSSSLPTNNNIMTTLLVHENKPSAAASLPTADDKSDDSDMEDVAPVSGNAASQDSEEEEEVFVEVGNRKVPFDEAAALVDKMTDEQRDKYNSIARSIYADMYD